MSKTKRNESAGGTTSFFMAFHIHPARTASEIRTATELIIEYAASLGIDLAYQDFSTEIESMPGKYAPPDGEILLAIDDENSSNTLDVGASDALEKEVGRYTVGEEKCKKDKTNDEESDITSRVLGCVALRPLPAMSSSSSSSSTSSSSPQTQGQNPCELKRLYVLPSARGRGVGRALLRAIIAFARGCGYTEMRLDTLADMHRAMALYREIGFKQIEAYYKTPVAGTVFFALTL